VRWAGHDWEAHDEKAGHMYMCVCMYTAQWGSSKHENRAAAWFDDDVRTQGMDNAEFEAGCFT